MIQPELITVHNINYSPGYRSNHFFIDSIHNPEIHSHKQFLNNPFSYKKSTAK